MWSLLKRTPKPGKLSEKVQKTLLIQFELAQEKVEGLSSAQKPAKLNGRPIRRCGSSVNSSIICRTLPSLGKFTISGKIYDQQMTFRMSASHSNSLLILKVQ